VVQISAVDADQTGAARSVR